MKSKKTLLLLLIGAAAILTVIWSTRNTAASKPILLTTTTNSLVIPHVKLDNTVESSSRQSSAVQEQCPIIPNVKADIDTSDVYPTLNFNVSLIVFFMYSIQALSNKSSYPYHFTFGHALLITFVHFEIFSQFWALC